MELATSLHVILKKFENIFKIYDQGMRHEYNSGSENHGGAPSQTRAKRNVSQKDKEKVETADFIETLVKDPEMLSKYKKHERLFTGIFIYTVFISVITLFHSNKYVSLLFIWLVCGVLIFLLFYVPQFTDPPKNADGDAKLTLKPGKPQRAPLKTAYTNAKLNNSGNHHKKWH